MFVVIADMDTDMKGSIEPLVAHAAKQCGWNPQFSIDMRRSAETERPYREFIKLLKALSSREHGAEYISIVAAVDGNRDSDSWAMSKILYGAIDEAVAEGQGVLLWIPGAAVEQFGAYNKYLSDPTVFGRRMAEGGFFGWPAAMGFRCSFSLAHSKERYVTLRDKWLPVNSEVIDLPTYLREKKEQSLQTRNRFLESQPDMKIEEASA